MCVLACLSVLRLDPTPQHNLISQTLQTEFFSKYNNSIQRDMAAAMKMEHFKANEVVFYQGDQPGVVGKYYIIAYGRVRITVEQTTQLDEAEPKGKANAAGKAKAKVLPRPKPKPTDSGCDLPRARFQATFYPI